MSMLRGMLTIFVVLGVIALGYWYSKNTREKIETPSWEATENTPPKNFKYPTENPPYGNPDISDILPR